MAHSNLELADTELLVESIQRKRIPPVKLQEALLEIVQNHASVARLFADKLLMDTKDETVSVDPEDSDASAKQSDSEEQDDEADDDRFKAGIKRKTESRDNANRGRTLMWKTCMNCEEVYNKNWEGACQFHPGERELDDESDVWADHDDYVHGPPEDLEEDCPEGFIWSCCDARGDVLVGCEKKRHQAR